MPDPKLAAWIERAPQQYNAQVGALTGDHLICQLALEEELYLELSGATAAVHRGRHPAPNLTVTTRAEDWLAVLDQRTTTMELMARQTLRIAPLDGALLFMIAMAFRTAPATREELDRWLIGADCNFKAMREFQIAYLKKAGLEPRHRLLDIGCGSLRGGIPIIGYLDEGRYHGVDVRSAILVEARAALESAGLEHKRATLVHCQGLAGLNLAEQFDLAWAANVFEHLRDPVLDECLAFVRRHLAPSGTFHATAYLGEPFDGRGWMGFPDAVRPLGFYEQAALRHRFAVIDLGSSSELGLEHTLPSLAAEIATGSTQHLLRFTPG